MVANVNGELITYSDLLRQLALQPNMPIEAARADDLQRRKRKSMERNHVDVIQLLQEAGAKE